jgi:hypothetical protein
MASPNVIVAAGTNLDDGSRSALQVSVDGTAWAVLDVSAMSEGADVAFDGANTWVAVGRGMPSNGYTGGIAMSSTNGNVWSVAGSAYGHANQTLAVCYSPGDTRWYATGLTAPGRSVIVRSDPGLTTGWTAVCQDPSSAFFGYNNDLSENIGGTFFQFAAAYSIATNGGNTIVAAGYPGEGNASILWADTSKDGSFWYNATDYDTNDIMQLVGRCVAYNGNIWVATGGSYICVSRDGKVWKKAFYTQALLSFLAVEWNGQYWLAIGYNTIYKSYDGYVWDLFTPSSSGFFNCTGWNGTRWLTGGYGIDGTQTMQSLTATDTAWAPCTDFTNTSITTLFTQTNNFANRVLLPNCPPPPVAAIHTSNRPPTSADGQIGDTWVWSGPGVPTNTYGPKYEIVPYGIGGSVYFSKTSNYNLAQTTTGSSNYDIGSNDYTINWWMSVPQHTVGLQLELSPIFGISMGVDVSGISGPFGVSINTSGGIYATFSGDTVSMNATADLVSNSWQFCTLTRSNGTTKFYLNGSNTYTDLSLYSNAYLGDSSSSVLFGANSLGTATVTNLLMTNFRWTTGYSDPSAADVPTSPLTTISGTVLLFTMSDGPSVWVDSALDTSMTVATYNSSPLSSWTGLNPFGGNVTLSWGTPSARTPYQYVGYGVPQTIPSGSIPGIGDTYLDLSTGYLYSVDLS